MSGLLFLQSGDFNPQQTAKGGTLVCHSIRGLSLILMYATKCEYCRNLIPIFKRLPGTIGGCQFGMVNIENERELVRMSIESVVPIGYVPLLILFVDGRPFIRYDGAHDENEIRNFLMDVTARLQAKQKFSRDRDTNAGKPSTPGHRDHGRSIPAFTVGYPLYGEDDDWYKEFEEAYPGK